VKRRPQSRKARLAAARISSIDIGYESNLNESSHLFGSSSDLINYENSSILNDDLIDSSNNVQNENQESLNNKSLFNINDNKTETNKKVNKLISDLFDDDLNPFELTQEEINTKNGKEMKFDDNVTESKLIYNEQIPKIKKIPDNHMEIESKNEKNSEIESVIPHNEIKLKYDKEIKVNVIEAEENKSKSITQSITLSKKSNTLFDDDDEDLFSPTYEKVKKSSSNIFDSDDEFEFKQKFTKKNFVKTDSIFGDDSDDDLFSTSSKPSNSLASQKPNG